MTAAAGEEGSEGQERERVFIVQNKREISNDGDFEGLKRELDGIKSKNEGCGSPRFYSKIGMEI